MNGITHIFFDLDHTLWDYETNARETLTEIFEKFGVDRYYTTPDAFINSFHYTNHRLWKRYNEGEIDREFIRTERFKSLFEDRGSISNEMNVLISSYFFTHCPSKGALMEGAVEVLDHLHGRYTLGIITNGFEDTQNVKLRSSGLSDYFDHVITSETAGHRKPSPDIFDLALEISGANSKNAVMIGDNFNTDIKGAKKANWVSFWFNPDNRKDVTHEPQIQKLSDLMDHF